jgi:hypothetical protein
MMVATPALSSVLVSVGNPHFKQLLYQYYADFQLPDRARVTSACGIGCGTDSDILQKSMKQFLAINFGWMHC